MTGRKAGERGPNDEYWVLKGSGRNFFVCVRFGKDERAALCVFDSRAAAEEHLRSLSEPQMFLDTLEQYGLFTPLWVHRERLLPEAYGVSRRGLWEAIEDIGVGYVAMNLPAGGTKGGDLRAAALGDLQGGMNLARRLSWPELERSLR